MILFSTNQKWGSRFIRWVTRGTCSHVAILLPSAIVVHSTMVGGGSHLDWYEHFREANTVVDCLPWTITEELFTRLRTGEGTGYDWILMFTMGLRRLGFPIKTIDNPYRDLCTEEVSQYVLNDKTTKYTPQELLDYMKGKMQ
jgi:hypothetical protein